MQKATAPPLTTATLAVADSAENAPPPDFGLQVKAVTDRPGCLQAGVKLQHADVVALGIRQIQVNQRSFAARLMVGRALGRALNGRHGPTGQGIGMLPWAPAIPGCDSHPGERRNVTPLGDKANLQG